MSEHSTALDKALAPMVAACDARSNAETGFAAAGKASKVGRLVSLADDARIVVCGNSDELEESLKALRTSLQKGSL